jgi:hypothetical protein
MPSLGDSDLSKIAEDAQRNPSYVILKGWEDLAHALRGLYEVAMPGERLRVNATPVGIAATLRKEFVVNDAFVAALTELRQLRNDVAHGQHDPSAGEALAYAETARELTRACGAIALLHPRSRPTHSPDVDALS